MIDRAHRDLLAENLRQLVSGMKTNLEFDKLFFDDANSSADPSIYQISHYAWYFYDDFKEHRLEISEGARNDFSRAVLFLHSDLEFEWSSEPAIKRLLKSILSRFQRNQPPSKGQVRYWPFFRKSDYQKALADPRLLAGNAEQDAPATS